MSLFLNPDAASIDQDKNAVMRLFVPLTRSVARLILVEPRARITSARCRELSTAAERPVGYSDAGITTPQTTSSGNNQGNWWDGQRPASAEEMQDGSAEEGELERELRPPRSVLALHLQPLRREAKYGIPSCDLQLRSFTVTNLKIFIDFALRAAYFLNLPAIGPIPLPRIVDRWTVPRSHFIFTKQSENFERVTLRRLIQIRDGHPESVQTWLAFLQKHAYYGIGMKANVWQFSKLGLGKTMDEPTAQESTAIEEAWSHMGQHHPIDDSKIQGMLEDSRKKALFGKKHPST